MIRALFLFAMGPLAVVGLAYALAFWRTTLVLLGLAVAGFVVVIIVALVREARRSAVTRSPRVDPYARHDKAACRLFDPAMADPRAVMPRPAQTKSRPWQASAVIKDELR